MIKQRQGISLALFCVEERAICADRASACSNLATQATLRNKQSATQMQIFNPHGQIILPCQDGKHYILKNHLDVVASAAQFVDSVVFKRKTYFDPVNWRGKQLVNRDTYLHLQCLERYVGTYSTSYTYNHKLKLLYDEYQKHPIRLCRDFHPNACTGIGEPISSICDDFFATLVRRADELELRKLLAEWNSRTNKNIARIHLLLARLFEKRERIQTLAFTSNYHAAALTQEEIRELEKTDDEFHQREFRDNMEHGTHRPYLPPAGRIPFEAVRADRQRLFGNLKGKTSLFRSLAGHCWFIGSAPVVGYYITLVFFFDQHSPSLVELSQGIDQYWREDITGGRGFLECHNNAKLTPVLGLGPLSRSEKVKRLLLTSRFLGGLARTSQYAYAPPGRGCHLFGSSVRLPSLGFPPYISP